MVGRTNLVDLFVYIGLIHGASVMGWWRARVGD
jgi:hypothetical protein